MEDNLLRGEVNFKEGRLTLKVTFKGGKLPLKGEVTFK